MPLVDANFFNVFCVVEIYSNHTLPLILFKVYSFRCGVLRQQWK
jgi:hypothetical protein